MNPLMLARIAYVLVVFAAGFGAGWTLNGWRLGADVANLEVERANLTARVGVLEPANERCAADVASVREAFSALQKMDKARAAKAAQAVAGAKAEAEAAEARARAIETAPRPAKGKECEAIIQEERDYAVGRQVR